jgi:hypothetical protein
MKKQTLLLITGILCCILFLPLVKGAVIYSNDFESGNVGTWSSKSSTGISVSYTHVLSDSYSLKTVSSGGSSYSTKFLTQDNLASPNNGFVIQWLEQFNYIPEMDGKHIQLDYMRGYVTGEDAMGVRFSVYNDSGQCYFASQYNYGVWSSPVYISSIIAQKDVTYAFEFFCDKTSHLAGIKINGEELISIGTEGTTLEGAFHFMLGGGNVDIESTLTIYYDDLVIYDDYFDSSPSPTPIPTPSPSPTATPTPTITPPPTTLTGLMMWIFYAIILAGFIMLLIIVSRAKLKQK